jgi:hypothetical protein
MKRDSSALVEDVRRGDLPRVEDVRAAFRIYRAHDRVRYNGQAGRDGWAGGTSRVMMIDKK